jgi:D-alanyl-D-alanine carboxypeptidase
VTRVPVSVVAMIALLGACSGDDGGARSSMPSRRATTSSTTSTSTTTTTVAAPVAGFRSSVAPVTAPDLGASWRPGCPVGPEQLRLVTVTLVGFDGVDHPGSLVVHADVANAVVEVFRQLHAARFPVREMHPIRTQAEFEDFETPDDNTTGFSCRPAVNTDPTPSWSNHAYGRAIDVNPIENPYLNGGRIIPSLGAALTDRTDVRPGMAVAGNPLVRAFASVGWQWGATFSDYQHFSAAGG